jgi:hypothetical protein
MIHPSEITQKQLDEFFQYIEKPYRNSFVTSNWDQDLYAVFVGAKPLCLIDNDFLPVSNTHSNFDYEMRFAMQHAGLKKVVLDVINDPTSLYYWPRHWKNACLLYMFHEGKFDNETSAKIETCFDYFQGILLGYKRASIALYDYDSSTHIKRSIESYSKIYKEIDWIDVDLKYKMASNIITQLLPKLTEKHRAMFSQTINNL